MIKKCFQLTYQNILMPAAAIQAAAVIVCAAASNIFVEPGSFLLD